jgi:hypothetical protein
MKRTERKISQHHSGQLAAVQVRVHDHVILSPLEQRWHMRNEMTIFLSGSFLDHATVVVQSLGIILNDSCAYVAAGPEDICK